MGCEAPKNRRNMEAILGRVGFRRKSSNAAGLSSETGCEGEVYILCFWMTGLCKVGYLELTEMTKYYYVSSGKYNPPDCGRITYLSRRF